MVAVYTLPSCMQCKLTYDELDRQGVSYEIVDLSKQPEMVEYVQDLDPTYLRAPVVVVNEREHWAGFQPDCIRRIAAAGIR